MAALTHKTAEGPSVTFRSASAPRHPIAAPNKSTPYTRLTEKGLRVSARLMTTPQKKNGTDKQSASSVHIQTVLANLLITGANVIWSARQIAVVRAPRELK